jgi:hypothetical protein
MGNSPIDAVDLANEWATRQLGNVFADTAQSLVDRTPALDQARACGGDPTMDLAKPVNQLSQLFEVLP